MANDIQKSSDYELLGSNMLKEAQHNLQQKAEDRLVQIAEHVLSRIVHHQTQVKIHTQAIELYERKKLAIEKGLFTIDKQQLSIVFNEKELNDLA